MSVNTALEISILEITRSSTTCREMSGGNGRGNAIRVELGVQGKENMMEGRESTVRTLLIPQILNKTLEFRQ